MNTQDLISKSKKLDFEDIDFREFEQKPLNRETLRCLEYMRDVEGYTICYLRDVLVTRSHKDPEITAFLSAWAYEEYFHGEAIAKILEAHGIDSSYSRVKKVRLNNRLRDFFKPILFSITSLFDRNFPALHMTWGALNELSTQSGYMALSAKANNRTLTELLTRIMKQEGRHIDFYYAQAKRRLSNSKIARFKTKLMLKLFWHPVGYGIMPKSEVKFLLDYLFGDDAGKKLLKRVDNRMKTIPGLEKLNLAQNAFMRLGKPAL